MSGILSRMRNGAPSRILARYSQLQNLPVVSRGVKAGYRDSFTRSRNSVDTRCTPSFIFAHPNSAGFF
ncbi:hypothetical protein A8H40_23760 [Burkholderia multivorans]|uniref:Uncharacterized protein n=1 Tax=Burkholderia multivorans TaxID=87883 RepID=A0A8E2RXH7_9BURK|nr:hypothetical protein A8H40_23760 [Burkholderia multivorans]PRD83471.1 hypothetical protein C6P76_21635 [Burkholderia multivorans]PRE11549.1 hypothetical protein C6P92_21130 [Burkholderia multivorans]PRE30111.1 hypothetical protein C6P79_06895 [Burkholderia multivorans]PRE68944.1 hypothetical protein C6P86_09630 [Burkholderia multivorans]